MPSLAASWTAVAAEFDYAPPSARDVDYVLRAGVRTEVAVDSRAGDVEGETRGGGSPSPAPPRERRHPCQCTA